MDNRDRFFQKEKPELLHIKGGKLRLYLENMRLAVSKPSWWDKDNNLKMGKTVTVNLEQNKGNIELIELLSKVIELLKTES